MENDPKTIIKPRFQNLFLLLRKPDFYFGVILVVTPFLSLLLHWSERSSFSFWLGFTCVATGALILSFLPQGDLSLESNAGTNLSKRIWETYRKHRKWAFPLTGVATFVLFWFLIPKLPPKGVPEFLAVLPTLTPGQIYITPIAPTLLSTSTRTSSITQIPTNTPQPAVYVLRVVEWDFSKKLNKNQNYFVPIQECEISLIPCWTDSPQGNYLDNHFYILQSFPIDLKGDWEHIYLFFDSEFDTEPCCDKTTVYVNETPVWLRTGHQEWRQNEPIDLMPKYKNQPIHIMFELFADGGNNYDGWYIQNVKLVFIAP